MSLRGETCEERGREIASLMMERKKKKDYDHGYSYFFFLSFFLVSPFSLSSVFFLLE